MKIPIFEEILVESTDPIGLEKTIVNCNIGIVPCYVNFSHLNIHKLQEVIASMEDIIVRESLHPLYPYPFYIVTSENIKTFFPTVKTIKDLPEHFFRKVKRPSNKELLLLNKLTLKIEKIRNLKLFEITQDLKESGSEQKKLYLVTKELHFLESLSTKLSPKNKKI